MAMNKKEQELFEHLKTQLALRHTEKIDPDVKPPPSSFSEPLSTGFLPVAAGSDSARVEPACSSSINHGIGTQDKTSTQNSAWLYSTKLLALRALRYQVEQYCAKRLRKIDKMIEALETEK